MRIATENVCYLKYIEITSTRYFTHVVLFCLNTASEYDLFILLLPMSYSKYLFSIVVSLATGKLTGQWCDCPIAQLQKCDPEKMDELAVAKTIKPNNR